MPMFTRKKKKASEKKNSDASFNDSPPAGSKLSMDSTTSLQSIGDENLLTVSKSKKRKSSEMENINPQTNDFENDRKIRKIIQDFDEEVDKKILRMEKETEAAANAIRHIVEAEILKLTPQQRSMTVREFLDQGRVNKNKAEEITKSTIDGYMAKIEKSRTSIVPTPSRRESALPPTSSRKGVTRPSIIPNAGLNLGFNINGTEINLNSEEGQLKLKSMGSTKDVKDQLLAMQAQIAQLAKMMK